jgi:hypothetical protein
MPFAKGLHNPRYHNPTPWAKAIAQKVPKNPTFQGEPSKLHPTKRQYALAQEWVNNELCNGRMSFEQMTLRAGYSPATANHVAGRQIRKPGVQQAIMEIQKSMRSALVEKGVDPDFLASKVHQLLVGEFPDDKINFRAINFGLEHALKIGIGGGYAPEKSIEVKATISPEELRKFGPLKEEFEERMREAELSGATIVELPPTQ